MVVALHCGRCVSADEGTDQLDQRARVVIPDDPSASGTVDLRQHFGASHVVTVTGLVTGMAFGDPFLADPKVQIRQEIDLIGGKSLRS
jgi:hypothetical protein